jgi:trimethylamine:corrinoid methyltransferase-like protein
MPLAFTRQPLIAPGQVERIHAVALRVLREIGLQVLRPDLLQRLRDHGFRTRGDRVIFEPATIEAHVDEMRCCLAERRQETKTADAERSPSSADTIILQSSTYPLNVFDLESGRAVPYTTERLIAMCKLIDSMADEAVDGTPPGIPVDQPPVLQQLVQFQIAALYARQRPIWIEPSSSRTIHALLDMAEAVGCPMDDLAVYLPSPLRLGGETLEIVLASLPRLSRLHVSSMPTVGATAPVHPFGALATAAAELMGGMVALRALTDKPVTFRVAIWPFDLRAGSLVFGAPETFLFQLLLNDLNRFYGHSEPGTFGNALGMAPYPGPQAAAERATILMAGAGLGWRRFLGAGTLGLDEVFSAAQLLIDVEIRNWVERALRGASLGEQAVSDWVAEIRAGVEDGFMTLDSTLDGYLDHVWYPRYFRRAPSGSWLAQEQPDVLPELRADARRRIAAHDYEPPPDQRRAIERILCSARRAVD